MEYRRFGQVFVIRLGVGDEVVARLGEVCAKENVRLASVSGIGATDRVRIGLFDPTKRTYDETVLTGPMEIVSLLGNVTEKDGAPFPHLHVAVADERFAVHGGHVFECRISVACEIVLTSIDGRVGRRIDPELGVNVLDF
ncbi:MAG: PPC domain-containing DNA-binding protein [Candidatus Izemoplasmatales bacterium]